MKHALTIVDPAGLHARPVSLLVQIANKYPDQCFIHYNGHKATLKSILFVMSLGVPYGSEVEIEITGDNEVLVYEEMLSILKEHQVI